MMAGPSETGRVVAPEGAASVATATERIGMPRKPNYRFERNERERIKAAKKAARAEAKAEAKKEKAEKRAESQGDTSPADRPPE